MGGSIARNAKHWLCLQAQFLPKELFESFRLRHKPVAEFIRVGLLLQLQILRCPIYHFVEAATVVTIKIFFRIDDLSVAFGPIAAVKAACWPVGALLSCRVYWRPTLMGALPNLPMIEGAIVRTCIERLGKPAHRARSAPGWLLHLPLALGILVTQAQEETFAATSGYVTLTVRHVERQRANWRTVEKLPRSA